MKIEFKKSLIPENIRPSDWSDWTWQLRSSLKNISDFSHYFALADFEKKAFEKGSEIFNVRTTPYYAALASKNNVYDPIRRILVPHEKELFDQKQAELDPLGERKMSNQKTSRIIHRYSDRVLFLITDICSVYCRYCTRKHFTGADQAFIKSGEYEESLSYIKNNKGLREVILSGGDPLTISDAQLDRVLYDLRRIDHVEIIRIGSRMPVVAPMRITDDLIKIIKRNKPVFLMTHFNHPKELTAESAEAVEKFVDNGIPVMNQMVLLNGVNNHAAIVQALSRRLLFLRAKPYYMFQCDPSIGTDYLRTSIDNSLAIQKELWGHLSGLAMPNLSVDIPNGGGKTYYAPKFETSQSSEKRTYTGWDGVESEYINPDPQNIVEPIDVEDYMSEWHTLKNSRV
ncbi:MAG: KamA family radical SAM protein [Pseudobdellovibrio sp.]